MIKIPSDGFRGVSLKAELVSDVEKFLENYVGYRGVAEFVSEAIRLRMDELRGKKREV